MIKTILPALGLSVTLLITGCQSGELETKASQAQSQAGQLLTRLSQGVGELGEQARQVAAGIASSVEGFLEDVDAPRDEESFRQTWADLKLKFQEMADQAVSEETRARIDAAIVDLDAQFQMTLADLKDNKDVQAAKDTMNAFWDRVKTELGTLMD